MNNLCYFYNHKDCEFSQSLLIFNSQRFAETFIFFRLRTSFFKKNRTSVLKLRTTEHRGREGEHDQVTMCCLETTVYFSPVIDRPRVSVSIVRGLCDDWSKMKSASFITDEQMYCHCVQAHLVTVRIHCLSVRRIQPHIYSRRSSP
jgi:hypothetical protein